MVVLPADAPAAQQLRFRLRQGNYNLWPHVFYVDNVTVTELSSNFTAGLQPDVVEYYDYDPFGMQIAKRSTQLGKYRYGFNGMEDDTEIKGIGNNYDFGARMYDPRVGRFFSVDPLDSKTPDTSGYSISGDSPIFKIDKNGEIDIVIHVFKSFKGKYYEAYSYTMSIDTDEDIKNITRTTLHINAYADFEEVEGSSSTSIFKGIKNYVIKKDTGLNKGEVMKKKNFGVWALSQFMVNNPFGTGKFTEAMTGEDIITGEKLDGIAKSIRYTEGLISLITLGRSTSAKEFIKEYAVDLAAEAAFKSIFNNDNFEDNGELMQKVSIFIYQTYKLSKAAKGDIVDTVNSLVSRGLKGKELLEAIKSRTNIDLTKPADKYQAAKRAVEIINSEAHN